MGQYNVDFVGC